jgi:hypothetical protein
MTSGIHTLEDFPSSMDPLQSYTSTALQPIARDEHSASGNRELMISTSGDENISDPVGALLRAAEIVDRNCKAA